MVIECKNIIKRKRFKYYVNQRNIYMGIKQYEIRLYPANLEEVYYGDEKIKEGSYKCKPYYIQNCRMCLDAVPIYSKNHWHSIEKLCCDCFINLYG